MFFLDLTFLSLGTASYHNTAVTNTDSVLAFMLMKCGFEIVLLIAYYDRVIYAHVLVNVAQVVYCITSFQTDNFSLRHQF
jgi:hypothetical protein